MIIREFIIDNYFSKRLALELKFAHMDLIFSSSKRNKYRIEWILHRYDEVEKLHLSVSIEDSKKKLSSNYGFMNQYKALTKRSCKVSTVA